MMTYRDRREAKAARLREWAATRPGEHRRPPEHPDQGWERLSPARGEGR